MNTAFSSIDKPDKPGRLIRKPTGFSRGVALYLVVCLTVFSACESSDSNSGPEVTIQLSVDLPESVAVESDTSQSLSGTLDKVRTSQADVTDDLRKAFDVIREFAGIAESLGQVVGEFLVEIEQDAASEGYNFSETITGTSDGLLIQLGPGSGERDKSINIWHVASEVKILEADWDGEFRGNDPYARGTVRMNGLAFDISGMFIEMEFDTADEDYGHYMNIRVRGIPEAGFDALSLFAAKDADEVTVSGNVYFSDIAAGDSEPFFSGADRERNYMFAASADVSQDIAAVDIALPPTDITVASAELASIFDDYSYGDVYKAAVFDWIDSAATTQTLGIKTFLQNQGFDFSSQTADELATFLAEEILPNLSGNEAAEVQAIVFAFQLENSFYADREGLVSNGSDIPSGEYESLAGNLETAKSALLSAPADVRGLNDASTSFYIDFERPDYP